MTDDRKRKTGGEVDAALRALLEHEWVTKEGDAILANNTIADLIQRQSRALAESRAEVERLRSILDAGKQTMEGLRKHVATHKARAERLAGLLKFVSAVGVVMLFDSHRDDVLDTFTHDELAEIVRVTDHGRPEQVENIYREGWDAALEQEPQE